MRDFLDAILEFIESESLTDDEFDSLELDEADYTKEVHDALKAILIARENVSDQVKRLKLYFVAKGVDVSDSDSRPAASQIFIGSEL